MARKKNSETGDSKKSKTSSKKSNTKKDKKGQDDVSYIAYRYRAYPTEAQVIFFAKTFGCCRFLWNRFVEDGSYFYNTMGKSLNNTAADYKNDYPFLAEVDSYALNNVHQNYEKSMTAFFNGTSEYPKFKKKGVCKNSYTTNYKNKNIRFNGNTLRLPKIPGEYLLLELHREPSTSGKLKSATVTKEPDGAYYVSILYEVKATTTPVLPEEDKVRAIGLDMSVPDFFISSDNYEPQCSKYFRELQDKLAWEQRKLSRMVKGSNNYERQKTKIAKIHAKIKHQRNDMLQKLSTDMIRTYDVFCVEDLNLQAMAQTLNLGKSLNDNGWGMFINMLDYKCKRDGKHLVKIDRWFPSSQTCSHCGYKNTEVKNLSVREWTCPECGTTHNRDKNAAINILNEGLRILYHDM